MDDRVRDILEWIFCIIIAFILALISRYFIGTPTVVKQRSMFPTLQENQRLILNRTYRITKKEPERGDIITFEAPSKIYSKWEADQANPVAIYESNPEGFINRFVYYTLELSKKSYIKRVIGIEGDRIKIENNKVFVNGIKLDEDYLNEDIVTQSEVFTDFIVPKGYVFAMGDNRTKSTDCRELGCIPLEKVEGMVVFRFWPLNVFGKI